MLGALKRQVVGAGPKKGLAVRTDRASSPVATSAKRDGNECLDCLDTAPHNSKEPRAADAPDVRVTVGSAALSSVGVASGASWFWEESGKPI